MFLNCSKNFAKFCSNSNFNEAPPAAPTDVPKLKLIKQSVRIPHVLFALVPPSVTPKDALGVIWGPKQFVKTCFIAISFHGL